MKILVTGAAGFIGFHVARALLDRGDAVSGLDNLNAYYDPGLKKARLRELQLRRAFTFIKGDIADQEAMRTLFAAHKFDRVIHLAAEVRVRDAMDDPHAHISGNVAGFLNVLEGCRHQKVAHLVYASTASVYGANSRLPHSVHDNVDHPLSLYAATKKSNELMAHVYAQLCDLPVTGLRFFSVYGPWGRPDMAAFIFTRKILADEPIDVFNFGHCTRDFTYIDDIVEGVLRTANHPPHSDPAWNSETPDPATSSAPYRIYNVGTNSSVALLHFIGCIEKLLGKEARKNLLPLASCEIASDGADISDFARDIGFSPKTPVEDGLQRFISWYREYYRV